jgi:hypothetical protein
MQHAITQLRRAIAECGDFPIFVVTPWTRYASKPCCTDAGHVMNFQDPDSTGPQQNEVPVEEKLGAGNCP